MNLEKPSREAAVTNWLNTVLHERFSPALVVRQPSPDFTEISVDGSPGRVRVRRDERLFPPGAADAPCGLWHARDEGWRAPCGEILPAPGASSLRSPLIENVGGVYTIHYDVLRLAFWMMTRQEEVGRKDLDAHDRFPATSSHAYKHGYLDRPIVDEWLAILGQVIARTWPGLPLNRLQFSLRVSHDVDAPARYGFTSVGRLLRTMAGDVLRRHDPIKLLDAPIIWRHSRKTLHARDPFNTFDWIMHESERHGLTSAFYFICGRTHPSRDALYEPTDPAIRDLMRRIHARGHEIGLHPSYNTFRDPGAIASEAFKLKKVCDEEGIRQNSWGGRMHFLRWQTPATLYGWEQAGMTYDSTLGYAELPGFRCGTCFEYPAFDPVAGKALELRIRPLIAMECTVMARRYMNLGVGDAALGKFMQLANACRAVQGTFTLLWHNTLLEGSKERSLYTRLLAGTAGAERTLLQ